MSYTQQVSAIPPPTIAALNSGIRRSANFSPSTWVNNFLPYVSDDKFPAEKDITSHQKLKADIRRMFLVNDPKHMQKLCLIDSLQRLGISYHFETEISHVLKEIQSSYNQLCTQSLINDLHADSLLFRLLRQEGYNVSSDIFNKFKDSGGGFKETLTNDAQGMLSLYEAANLRMQGEDILDEALAFTTTHLQSGLAAQLFGSPLAEQIANALKQPLRKRLIRLEARNYLPLYEQDAFANQTILTFAKLDFNILQKVHQKELADILKWWKELDFSTKLPFARDRIVECYFWILGVFFEPERSLARRTLTKVISVTSVLDDVYDVYGTPEELKLFTECIERWDIVAMDKLPEYMRTLYKAVLDIYEEMGEEFLLHQGKSYRIFYAKEAMKKQVRSYYEESKWFHQHHVPTLEDYMSVATISSGYPLLAMTSFVAMEDIVTRDSLDWLSSEPKIVKALSIMCRLMDDIVSHKFEQERGHVASSIECYMKQYDATEEEATGEFKKQIANAWKDINEGCLYPTAVPLPLLMPILNLARVMEVLYKEEDGYTNPGNELKEIMSSLLLYPVPFSSLY